MAIQHYGRGIGYGLSSIADAIKTVNAMKFNALIDKARLVQSHQRNKAYESHLKETEKIQRDRADAYISKLEQDTEKLKMAQEEKQQDIRERKEIYELHRQGLEQEAETGVYPQWIKREIAGLGAMYGEEVPIQENRPYAGRPLEDELKIITHRAEEQARTRKPDTGSASDSQLILKRRIDMLRSSAKDLYDKNVIEGDMFSEGGDLQWRSPTAKQRYDNIMQEVGRLESQFTGYKPPETKEEPVATPEPEPDTLGQELQNIIMKNRKQNKPTTVDQLFPQTSKVKPPGLMFDQDFISGGAGGGY